MPSLPHKQIFWWVSYIHRDIKTTHNSPPWKLSSLKNERKKKIFFRDHVEKSDYSTRWYETIDYVFFFFHYKVSAYDIHLWWLCSLLSNQNINWFFFFFRLYPWPFLGVLGIWFFFFFKCDIITYESILQFFFSFLSRRIHFTVKFYFLFFFFFFVLIKKFYFMYQTIYLMSSHLNYILNCKNKKHTHMPWKLL